MRESTDTRQIHSRKASVESQRRKERKIEPHKPKVWWREGSSKGTGDNEARDACDCNDYGGGVWVREESDGEEISQVVRDGIVARSGGKGSKFAGRQVYLISN